MIKSDSGLDSMSSKKEWSASFKCRRLRLMDRALRAVGSYSRRHTNEANLIFSTHDTEPV